MKRPEFLYETDFQRWDDIIDHDPELPEIMTKQLDFREVLYAGLWLIESLEKLSCPLELINRIQYSAAKISYGRNPWEVVQYTLDCYQNNILEIEPDVGPIN